MATSSERIIIEGDVVRVESISLQYQAALKDVLPHMEVSKPVTLPTMARSQVFAHWDESSPNSKKLFILSELTPGIRNIRKGNRRYRLAMPWTYFWFIAKTGSAVSANRWELSSYYCFHAKDRYTDLDTRFIVARCPNVYSNGKICWGTTGASTALSLADRIDTLVNEWYLSTFNNDLNGEVPIPGGEPTYKRWVEESISDPNCWQKWSEWTSASVKKYTVRELLSKGGAVPTVENITLPNAIPEPPPYFTYGQWEEWFMTKVTNPEYRAFARIALDNLRADNTANVPTIDAAALSEDGGVPIDTSLEPELIRR